MDGAVSYMIRTKLVTTARFSLNKFYASNNFEQKRANTKSKLQEVNARTAYCYKKFTELSNNLNVISKFIIKYS